MSILPNYVINCKSMADKYSTPGSNYRPGWRKMTVRKIRRLDDFEEAIGIVHEVCKDDGLLVIRLGNISIILPEEMESQMRGHLGTRIDVLHTDIPQKEYLVRVIE